MSIKAVIWDYGGVLVRTEDQGPRNNLAQRLGVSNEELSNLMFNSENAVKGMRGEISGESHWAEVGSHFGQDGQELHEEFFAGDELDKKLMAFIRELRPKYRTALLSNAFSTLREHLEHGRKIADAFDEIVISAEVGLMKPDAEIYRLMLEELKLKADETVFVDDFIENVIGAREIGMHAVHFQSREQALEKLAEIMTHSGN